MPHIKKFIYNHKLLSVISAALLTVAVLTVLVNFNFLKNEPQKSINVTEQDGIYDLTDISSLEQTIIKLAPGAAYYPNIYLTPENFDTAISESTEHFEEIRADYLSQRFVLKVPENNDVYSITFNLSGRHAMKVYANGKLAAQTGQAGTTKQETEVWENNITFHGSAINGEIDILLNSAQFYHAKRGASLAELSLSKNETDPFFSVV
ncbi:hypothetical protein [Sedimentibacter sp.]|uniref:hypothetical protein n=1 Tax=Sedimentibacter sp. TaxID=1960295 RepID=UPI0028972A24|nr:hypothetical protein [Sedimentibacter sp.]